MSDKNLVPMGSKSFEDLKKVNEYGAEYWSARETQPLLGYDVSKAISDNIEPKIYPLIKHIKLKGKSCIKVQFKGTDIPYYAHGRAYIRVADEDRQLSAKELEGLILKKNKDKLRWDTEICKEAKLSDISAKKLKSFLKNAGLKYDTLRSDLEKLKLLSDRKLCNTAVILFAKKPQAFFPNARLRCAVFGTTDTSFTIDMQDFEGDLFFLIEKAEEYILKNIHIGMKLEGLRRIDVPEIDKAAFREAIINAFCHRDYREYDSVNIAVFKDHIEIRSPGLLYGGLTIETIRTKMVSERRNELIAEMLHRVHFIEKWGRGIRLILSKEPDTEFSEVGTKFVTTFKRRSYIEEVEKGAESWVKKLGEKLGENENRIVEIVVTNKFVTIPELSKMLKISTTAVENNIAKLKAKKILKRIGPDKGGYWEVVKK